MLATPLIKQTVYSYVSMHTHNYYWTFQPLVFSESFEIDLSYDVLTVGYIIIIIAHGLFPKIGNGLFQIWGWSIPPEQAPSKLS